MNKKRNRRFARKRALRMKHGVCENHTFRDGMCAASRGYGIGMCR